MTKDEKEKLLERMAQAKLFCTEFYGRLQNKKAELSILESKWKEWKSEYEYLDKILAEEEKLTICPTPGQARQSKPKPLTKEEILQVAEKLGISISIVL